MKTIIKNIKGVAMITVLFFLIIVTALATGAIMIATVQIKVAGSIAQLESARSTAEGAINYIIPLVQSVHFDRIIPAGYASIVVSTPTPSAPYDTIPRLVYELTDPSQRNNNDVVDSADGTNVNPNVTLTWARFTGETLFDMAGFTVDMDIDSIGTALMPGGTVEPSWAYHKGGESPLVSGYRITARASTPSGRYTSKMCQAIWLRAVM